MVIMNSSALTAHLGITYRQLDYLARSVLADPQILPGQGAQRDWPAEIVERLEVAVALHRAGADLPRAARAVHAGPPPTHDWVLLRDETVTYSSDPILLLTNGGGIVARLTPFQQVVSRPIASALVA